MIQLLAKRLALSVFTLWLVSVFVFFATEALPGDAASALLPQEERTAENIAARRRALGLDRPPLTRYVEWLRDGASGDWGDSYSWRTPVTDVIGMRMRNTFVMAALAGAIGVPLAIGMGVLAALGRDRWPDLLVSGWALIGMSLPEFVVGSLFILLFALHWPIFPAVTTLPASAPIQEFIPNLWLPIATLMVGMGAYIVRLVRTSMIDVLASDYVQMASLKGTPWRRVVLEHAVPNAILPTIHVTALTVAGLLGGVVVVETVFNYPGIGSLLVAGVQKQDLPLVQALVLLAAAIQIGLSFLADAVSIALNPRLRTARG